MEIYNRQQNGYIEVWLTNREQQEVDRSELTQRILSNVTSKKYKVIFFLSGSENMLKCTENLILHNLK